MEEPCDQSTPLTLNCQWIQVTTAKAATRKLCHHQQWVTMQQSVELPSSFLKETFLHMTESDGEAKAQRLVSSKASFFLCLYWNYKHFFLPKPIHTLGYRTKLKQCKTRRHESLVGDSQFLRSKIQNIITGYQTDLKKLTKMSISTFKLDHIV